MKNLSIEFTLRSLIYYAAKKVFILYLCTMRRESASSFYSGKSGEHPARPLSASEIDALPDLTEFAEIVEDEKPSVDRRSSRAPGEYSRASKQIVEVFDKAGFKSEVHVASNNRDFKEAIIFTKEAAATEGKEPTIRLYRGINHLDESLLDQIPYAMRSQNVKNGRLDKPTKLEAVRHEVNVLTHEPSYENLVAYVQKVRPLLRPEEQSRLDAELEEIEQAVLGGVTMRKELVFNQIKHLGGISGAEWGITPYLSATTDPFEASGYGQEGVVVIDIPLSEIEDFGAMGTEVAIKGSLDPKYISGILPRQGSAGKSIDHSETNAELKRSIAMFDRVQPPAVDVAKLSFARAEKLATQEESDRAQWEKDVELIRNTRAKKLSRLFSEVVLPPEVMANTSDILTATQHAIFDHYAERFGKTGRFKKNVADYDYDVGDGHRIKYDRNNITEEMLRKLRRLVEHHEDMDNDRQKRSARIE